MKTKKITISLLITASWLAASAFTVSRNTVVTIGKNTQMKLSNVDLRNDGVLIGDTASMLIMSATREQKISGNDTYLSSLKIDGKVNSNVGVLSLDGDLIMESGVLNIGTNTLVIYGELLGETETSYAWATTGTIEQRMAYLPAGRQVSILGFTFTPLTDAYDFCVIRSHNPIIRISRDQTIYSAKRVFTFPTMVDMTDVADVEKQAFMHEIGNMYKPTLFLQLADWQKVNGKNEAYYGVSRASIFSPDNLYFPKVIMPNSHTHNLFVVEGSEEYPNSRLTIFNQTGQQLYDILNYANDFDGNNLPCGTYYYVFYKEQDGQPVQRSFFEIIR